MERADRYGDDVTFRCAPAQEVLRAQVVCKIKIEFARAHLGVCVLCVRVYVCMVFFFWCYVRVFCMCVRVCVCGWMGVCVGGWVSDV